MNPVIKTKIIHTLYFYTPTYQSNYNIGGLEDLINFHTKKKIEFKLLGFNDSTYNETLNNITPETFDDFAKQSLDLIIRNAEINPYDLRVIIQWLVNKEVLPAGDYIVDIKK